MYRPSLSDARDKKNISELSLGLDFITKLLPRQFNWDKREWYDNNVSDGSKMKEAPTAGFIAQELDEAQTSAGVEWLNLVLKDNPEKWEATYGNLLPVMVKAIQELKTENDELKNRNETLEERLAKYEHIQKLLVKKMEELELRDNDVNAVKLGKKN
jgi:Chaperone of endosialidase